MSTRSWTPSPGSAPSLEPTDVSRVNLQQLYQQIILEHAKTRHGAAGWRTRRRATSPASPTSSIPTAGTKSRFRVAVHDDGAASLRHQLGRRRLLDLDGLGVRADATSARAWTGEELHASSTISARCCAPGQARGRREILGDAAAFEGVSRYAARVKCAMLSWVAAGGRPRPGAGYQLDRQRHGTLGPLAGRAGAALPATLPARRGCRLARPAG